MRSGIAGIVALVVLIAVVIVASASMFTVQQTEQALVLRFGEPVRGRGVVTTPGLHFKVPFIDTVVLLDNRILDLETPNQEVLASDNQRIEVDAFARYRIVDPLKFYQTVGTISRANNQLASVLNSAVRRVLGEANLPDIVRERREALMGFIRDQVNTEGGTLGVNVVDVRIRRADLPREISEKVYDRMKTERQREAANFRAQGAEQSQKIASNADREVTVLRATAQQQAEQLKGQGEADRNRIFAEAFNKDPDFFAFYRSMQAYDTALKPSSTQMVLSPASEFFRYFGNSFGTAVPASAQAPAGSGTTGSSGPAGAVVPTLPAAGAPAGPGSAGAAPGAAAPSSGS